jgi:prenylated cyclic peptide (anacyclamide/piricyclamide family)
MEKKTMTKKNLRPQQVAPVQRQTAAHSSLGEKGCQIWGSGLGWFFMDKFDPFAGDDGE